MVSRSSYNRPFPNSLPNPDLYSHSRSLQPNGRHEGWRDPQVSCYEQFAFFFFFCLDHSFWQGQRATVAWGFKCTFLDCSRETPDWRANSTGTGRREPEPESPHPPHLEPFSPWGTSRDYLPSASASGRASHTRPLRHVPVLPPSSPPLLQRVPPRQRPGGLTG